MGNIDKASEISILVLKNIKKACASEVVIEFFLSPETIEA